MVRLSALQLCSTPDVEENLASIKSCLSSLAAEKHHVNKANNSDIHIVVLPECCLFFGGADKGQLLLAQNQTLMAELQKRLAQIAIEYGVYLVAGSIPLLSNEANKFTNSSLVFSPDGEVLSRYDKIHLFDVEVEDNEKSYQESRYAKPGKHITTVSIHDIIVGQSICYDLRFPELFRCLAQQGAHIIVVPSAFTQVTGQAHWQALLQARAIENQVYIIASGQSGVHANGRATYGHSMIINPWGEIEACLEQGAGIITQEFDLTKLLQVRKAMPVHTHNQFKTNLKPS